MFSVYKKNRLFELFVILTLFLSWTAQGADGPRYAPVIPQGQIPEAREFVEETTVHSKSVVQNEKEELDKVLLPELKGLMFVDLPERVYAVSPDVEGVKVEQNSNFAFEAWMDFLPGMQKFIGKPLTLRLLKQMEDEIKAQYKTRSISYVGLQIPQQDASNGTLQVLLVEGKIHGVKVQGARYFSNEWLAKDLYAKKGNYFDESDVREDVLWLNRNPFRETQVKIDQVDENGNLDVTYKIRDQFPFRATAGYTDTGTLSTGIERVFVGATYGNLFGKSNLLNYQLTSTPDYQTVVNHSVNWFVPIAKTRNFFSMHGNYATIDYANQEGCNWGSGFDLNRRLWTKYTDEYRRSATFSTGLDFLHADTDLDHGGTTIAYPVETAQIVFGFDWNHIAEKGYIDFNAKLHISPGNFSKYNTDLYFHQFSGDTETRCDYLYTTLELDMLRHLENMDVHCRLFGQISSARMITYDQLCLGGAHSVRGYYQYTDEKDSGFITNLELLTPSKETCFNPVMERVPPYRHLGKHYKDDFQLYTFLDVGVGHNWVDPDAENDDEHTTTLAGTGVGCKYTFGPWVNLDFAYGWQLIKPDDEDYVKSGRPHLTVVICR